MSRFVANEEDDSVGQANETKISFIMTEEKLNKYKSLFATIRKYSKSFDADEIEPNLFLGSLDAAINEEELQKNNINVLLSVGMKLPNLKLTDYEWFETPDTPDAKIDEFFDKGIEFIEKNLEAGNRILVHCFVGISRSATIVAAYLIKKYKISVKEAVERMRRCRQTVNPNEGFILQLENFAEKINHV